MELPESSEKVEGILKRLMPSALSERGQRGVEDALSRLAVGGVVGGVVGGASGLKAVGGSWWPWLVGMPVAAAVAFVAALSLDGRSVGAGAGTEVAVVKAGGGLVPKEEDFVDMPMKVLEPTKRRAEFQWKGERLEVVCMGPEAMVKWYGVGGELKYEGGVAGEGLPAFWRQRAVVLEKDLRVRMGAEVGAME